MSYIRFKVARYTLHKNASFTRRCKIYGEHSQVSSTMTRIVLSFLDNHAVFGDRGLWSTSADKEVC
jgi:hypothetical protein